MPVSLVPFSAFKPDGGQFGGGMSIVRNALPLHGSWRPVQAAEIRSTVEDGPVTGAYVHIYQQARSVQFLRPDGVISNAGGFALNPLSIEVALSGAIDEVEPDASDFIYVIDATAAVAEVSLSDAVGAVTAADHYLRWQYRIPNAPTGTWTITAKVYKGSTLIATSTATGTGARENPVSVEYALTTGGGGEIAAIGGVYTDLRIRFTATAEGSVQTLAPIEDTSVVTWVDEAADAVDIFESIDEAVADDNDYIISPILAPGGATAIYRCKLDAALDPLTNAGFTLTVRGRFTNVTTQGLIARIYQGDTLIKLLSSDVVADVSLATNTFTMELADAALITDFEDLYVELEAVNNGIVPTEFQFARPDNYVSNTTGMVANTGTMAESHLLVDDVSPDDLTTWVGCTIAGAEVIWTLDDIVDPLYDASEGFSLHARCANDSASAGRGRLILLQGSTQVAYLDIDMAFSQSWTDFSYTLTQAEVAAITNYSSLRLKFLASTAGLGCTQAYFKVPEPYQVIVTQLSFEMPSEVRAEIGWAELEVPSASTVYRGDVPTIFAGTTANLYEVTPTGWNEISKVADGYGSALGSAWCFASFGNHVIATNFTDPVQWREDNTGDFKDLFASTLKPKARFCAPFRNQMMFSGINLSGHTTDEIWVSAQDDATDVDPALSTSSDYQAILSAAGQIMGHVGGEFNLIFKRRSIHRVEFVGGETIFAIRDVSTSIGTPYPKSIVSAEGLVYFWDGSTFRRTSGYDFPQAVGSQEVSDYLTDWDFNDEAIDQVAPEQIAHEDQVMVGWYDPSAGLLFWLYQAKAGTRYQHIRAVCYSPAEDRWATLLLPTEAIRGGLIAPVWASHGVQNPNVISEDHHLLRGTILFTNAEDLEQSWAKFDGAHTLPMTFRSKVMNIGMEENETPRYVKLSGVKPIYTVKPGSATTPDITVTVESCQNARFADDEVVSQVIAGTSQEKGWFPIDNSGFFFRFTVAVGSMSAKTIASFDGLYVEYQFGGRT